MMILAISSLILGILSIIIPFWLSARRYRISYVEHVNKLYLSQNDGDVEVSVSYKGGVCCKPLVVTKLVFSNVGHKDIIFNQKFVKPIEIKSSVIEFIDIKASSSDSDIAPVIKHVGDVICLSWDILKKGESVSVDVSGNVIDLDNIAKLEGNCFEVSCRAADIDRIAQKKHRISLFKLIWIILLSLCVMCNLLFAGELRQKPLVGDVAYKGEVVEDATILYNAFTNKYYISTTSKRVERYVPVDDVSTVVIDNHKVITGKYRLINISLIMTAVLLFILTSIYLIRLIIKYPSYLGRYIFFE